jgi:SAM-dependent methyltransferase
LWLVERGWRVTLLDISDVALAQAQAEAECRGLAIEVLNQDAGQAELGAKKFDLIMVFFFLDRALFPAITEALKPGGLLMYKTYTVDHPRLSGGRGPTHPMHLLKRNELVRAFSDLDMLFYREIVIGRGVAELVAQKPKVEVLGRRKTRRG